MSSIMIFNDTCLLHLGSETGGDGATGPSTQSNKLIIVINCFTVVAVFGI